MRFTFLVLFTFWASAFVVAQDVSSLPLMAVPSQSQDSSKPLVVYITGDGGFNSFSKDFARQLSQKGYSVIMLSSLKYFWNKKTPQQAAADVEKVIGSYKVLWKKNRVILMGYSFGADVLPFIYTRLAKDAERLVKNIVLVSPSNSTDFEVHVKQLFGKSERSGVSVIDEINRINDKPLIIMQAENETEKIETEKLKIRNFKLIVLKGGHHYDNNGDDVAGAIVRNL